MDDKRLNKYMSAVLEKDEMMKPKQACVLPNPWKDEEEKYNNTEK